MTPSAPRSRARIALIVLLLVVAACPKAPKEAPLMRRGVRADLTGCYRLFLRNGRVLDSNAAYNAMPFIQLQRAPRMDTAALPTFANLRLVTEAGSTDTVPGEFHLGPLWFTDSLTDTLRISFVDGFSGAVLALAAKGPAPDTLRGYVESHWDIGPPFITNRRRAMAIRAACPNVGSTPA